MTKATFWSLGSFSAFIWASGRAIIMTSVAILIEELAYQIPGVQIHVPDTVGSQAFRIGLHAKIVGMIVPMAVPMQMTMTT
jgi:hypothetical protein